LNPQDIKEEILRRLDQGESFTLSREEIEQIGVKAGLHKLRAAGLFLHLAGEVWAGHICTATGERFWIDSPPKEPLPRWTEVHLHAQWFQQTGKRFDKDIKEEILRRLQDARTSWITMSREEIEEIGVKAGLHKLRAIGEFERLAGEVWAGHLHSKNGPPFWFDSPPKEPITRWIAVDFPHWWFKRRGMLPSQAPHD
jgi:hypothetical protein